MTLPAPILAWWNARESREQKLLLAGVVFAVAAGLYAAVYPLFTMHVAASREFQAADSDYHWLKQQIKILSNMRSEAGGALPVYLPAEEVRLKIEEDLKKKKMEGEVAIEDAGGAKHVKVTLERSEGRQVMRWLEELTNGGYTVSALRLENKSGRLTGTIVIEV